MGSNDNPSGFKRAWKKLYNLIIGRYDMWQQLLNIAVLIAIFGSLASGIISVVLGNSPLAVTAFFVTAIFALFCLILSMKMKDVNFAAILFSILANFVLFPVMFFTSGGYHGGMPLWLLLSLVIAWVVIRKKVLYVIFGLSLAFHCVCIYYSAKHPEMVTLFESEEAVALDVIQSLALVSLIFGIIIRFQGSAYESKKNELDRANEALKNKNARITLQSMYALAKTIDAKDRYTKGHSMRVSKYSRMIAKRMGWSDAQIDELSNMAMLHDIGKIGVPDSIINKDSKLTKEEYDVIKKHPEIGYEILKEMPELKDVGIGARWHHERYDGKGYPDGLTGEEIPVPARIICVADAYDAMSSNRSYRGYLPQDVVKKEIEEGLWTQFDPKIGRIMLDIIAEDKNYELREMQ